MQHLPDVESLRRILLFGPQEIEPRLTLDVTIIYDSFSSHYFFFYIRRSLVDTCLEDNCCCHISQNRKEEVEKHEREDALMHLTLTQQHIQVLQHQSDSTKRELEVSLCAYIQIE